jgi:predicted DNA binding protein
VSALATQLGISHSAAQRVLNQLAELGRGGIDPGSPAFAAIAHQLGVSPDRLVAALQSAKQSMAGR